MSKDTCTCSGCDRPAFSRGYCTRCYQRAMKTGAITPHRKWVPTIAAEPQSVVFGSPLIPDRLWERITVTDDGCWRWGGALNNGYGVVRVGGKTRTLHLLMYEVFMGPRPKGLWADHTCHTLDETCWLGPKCPHRSCCLPLCMEFVTPLVNGQRGRGQGRKPGTGCPAGHPYEPPHLAYDSEGYPDCRTCRNARWRERYHRNKQLLTARS